MNPLKLAAAADRFEQSANRSRVVSGQWDAISLGLGLVRTAAMPHVLMRIYGATREARFSILYATGLSAYSTFRLRYRFGAMVLVGPEAVLKADGGAIWPRPSGVDGRWKCVPWVHMRCRVCNDAGGGAGLTFGVATLCHDIWANSCKANAGSVNLCWPHCSDAMRYLPSC
jgi:cation/acetate symporter